MDLTGSKGLREPQIQTQNHSKVFRKEIVVKEREDSDRKHG